MRSPDRAPLLLPLLFSQPLQPGGTNSLISHLDSTTGTQPVTGILAARRFSPPSHPWRNHLH
uniref:Uncharacterized protein n=1 Tax=Oryza nivara TaxID=4536 RepID=A0A0E0IKS9_ORYNI